MKRIKEYRRRGIPITAAIAKAAKDVGMGITVVAREYYGRSSNSRRPAEIKNGGYGTRL
jgi:hypothetical protein